MEPTPDDAQPAHANREQMAAAVMVCMLYAQAFERVVEEGLSLLH